MADCLGIYFDNNMVKYAKVIKNNNGTIEIKDRGIRFIRSTVDETLLKILNDVSYTENTPIVIGAPQTIYSSFQVFKQISNSDLQKVVKLEFEDWCEKKSVASNNFAHVYLLADAIVGDYRKGLMAVCDKELIEKYSKIGDYKVSKMYPTELLLYTDVPEDEKNYILIDMDKKITLTIVVSGKIVLMNTFETGMNQIISKFINVLGTYEKAYDACKQLNVFSDEEESTNKVQLEEIIEPIFQEILHNLTDNINKYKDNVSKVFLTGSGTLFTNLDTLFTEYFGVRCEILKPKFITDTTDGGVRNIAETIEALPAIALAKEYLEPATTNLEFIKSTQVKESFFEKVLGIIKVDKKNPEKPKTEKESKIKFSFVGSPNFSVEKITGYLMYPVIVCFLAIISYYIFSNIYINQITKIQTEINSKIDEYEELTILAKSDKSTIDTATNQYRSVNEEVENIKLEIENNQIGRISTYNVASFMQKIIKIIPTDVQLKTISSDDNKNVKIVAQSSKYPILGYFVASLRLQPDILTDVTVNSVNNSDIVTIEIGGVLP